MDLIHSIILGVVEGVTEFLPISSTAHLIFAGKLLGIPDSLALKSFDIAIQLGAILAILVLYPKRLLLEPKTMYRVTAAFIPTAILGAIFYPIIKHSLLDATAAILVALFVGGIFLIWFEKTHVPKTQSIDELSLTSAAAIGLIQSIAFLPGVSRSGASIIGGMYLGLSRKDAVEFSFLLAVPTMAAATLLDLIKSRDALLEAQLLPFVVGFFVSFASAYLMIKLLLRYVGQHDFTGFGIYHIILSLVLAVYFFG